jgi:hypothetical protein
MEIGVADTRGGDLYADLASPRGLELHVLDHDGRTRTTEDDGTHGLTT